MLAQEIANILDQQPGLLHRGEVSPAVELGPVCDVGELSVGELADRSDDVVREHRDADRYLAPHWRPAGIIVPGQRRPDLFTDLEVEIG